MAQGNREIGQSLYLESLSLYEQVYGILHPEVANAYLQLSSLYYSLDEKNAAVELARKAVIVAERTLGVDSAQTILSYLNLGLFEHATGNGKTALQYFLHAFGLLKVVYGANHPDSITTINNVAVILQSLHMYHASKIWFEASLRLSKAMYGEESGNTATLLFQLSQALALDDDLKGATERMREARNTFEKALGASHDNTKQADEWLGKLVSSAVARQKQQQPTGMRLPFSTRNRPFPQIGQQRSDAVGSAAGRTPGEKEMDERDINELVGFIMGQGQQGTPTKTKKKSTNPKRRTSRAAQTATA
ncbi:hypothetical protein LTS18_011217 [Coniosporium uncinatum]|uniref:Uncharacterized protein n=1 Tax=Coniosporium uncinatum TaxID=93489 RepID=A0ACC3DKB5_9PEZI|nr:hypothetical protein LTS18_011217 [Coniosporium uncinatum]